MNILMFTNTYLPHVGGVAMSIHRFAEELTIRGNKVRVVAPFYGDDAGQANGIFRVPAIKDFNGSGFSLALPAPCTVAEAMKGFPPDIVHSHHPYLLGNTALRCAALHRAPLVFTHHTLYELYTHYIPGDSVLMKRFVVNLAVSYSNLCDRVIAPSSSLASLLAYRGVKTPVSVIPTGIDLSRFSRGDREGFRKRLGIPSNAFVVGHVGRLAKEKNLEYLTLALSHYLRANPFDHVLVGGAGPMEKHMRTIFSRHGLSGRVHLAGILDESELPDAYRAMDVFAFTSQSETQGLVIMEAFASGLPVVALDGPGVRDVVRDRENGRLVEGADLFDFVNALLWVKSLGVDGMKSVEHSIRETVERCTIEHSVDELLSLYRSLRGPAHGEEVRGSAPVRFFATQSRLTWNTLSALSHAVTPTAREVYTCGSDFPPDAELQALLAHHPRLSARLLGYLVSLFIRTFKASWRTETKGLDIVREHLATGEPVLLSFWHGRYFPLFALFEGLRGCIFASCSFRGEVIAEVCRRFGYECILIPEHARKRSVQIMAKSILHYGAGAVAADGPRGPGRVFKRGSVQLSSDLGLTVIPASVASRPSFAASRRWDRFEVPLPFGKVLLLVGKGTVVPVGLKAMELESWSHKLKDQLDHVDQEVRKQLGSARHEPARLSALRHERQGM